MNAKEILNKIKWDKSEEPDKCSVFYIDRISKKLEKIEFRDIKNIEGNFLVIEKNSEEVEIPIHRIREIRNEDKLIWRRGL
jgi:uncharacterized protein (UPF0248 family)